MMNYELDFANMPDYVVIKTYGLADVQGFSDLLTELVESPQWIVGTKQLVDHRLLDLSLLKPQDIGMISSVVSLLAKKLGDGKCVFLMEGTSDLLTGNYYCDFTKQVHSATKISVNTTEAKDWLLRL